MFRTCFLYNVVNTSHLERRNPACWLSFAGTAAAAVAGVATKMVAKRIHPCPCDHRRHDCHGSYPRSSCCRCNVVNCSPLVDHGCCTSASARTRTSGRTSARTSGYCVIRLVRIETVSTHSIPSRMLRLYFSITYNWNMSEVMHKDAVGVVDINVEATNN